MNEQSLNKHWRFSVAPMMKWTTAECRKIHRLLNPQAMLYTEMVTTGAIIYGDSQRYLKHESDSPCALQLGGGNPADLAKAVSIAKNYSYQEINLNVGCPSDRVQNNDIGACLMKNPQLVSNCLNAMQSETDQIISIKHRLAVDDDNESSVIDFVDYLYHHTHCRHFIIHARKAILNGLSPKDNRLIPPLKYDWVYKVKNLYPDCIISINGGIENIEQINEHLKHVDGVMLGRAAYQNPQIIAQANILFDEPPPNLADMVDKINALLIKALENKESLWSYYRHLLGLFQSCPGAKRYRRILSEQGRNCDASIAVWQAALQEVSY